MGSSLVRPGSGAQRDDLLQGHDCELYARVRVLQLSSVLHLSKAEPRLPLDLAKTARGSSIARSTTPLNQKSMRWCGAASWCR